MNGFVLANYRKHLVYALIFEKAQRAGELALCKGLCGKGSGWKVYSLDNVDSMLDPLAHMDFLDRLDFLEANPGYLDKMSEKPWRIVNCGRARRDYPFLTTGYFRSCGSGFVANGGRSYYSDLRRLLFSEIKSKYTCAA